MGSIGRWITYCLGVAMTGFLVLVGAVTLYALVQQLAGIASGQPHGTVGGAIGLTFLMGFVLWYLNLLEVFRQLRAIDYGAYEAATKGRGFIAFFWSSGAALWFLHCSLLELRRAVLPRRFERRVRIAIAMNRLLLAAVGVLVLGLLLTVTLRLWSK